MTFMQFIGRMPKAKDESGGAGAGEQAEPSERGPCCALSLTCLNEKRKNQVAALKGFSIKIPSMTCPDRKSSERIFATLALEAAVTMRASQKEIR